jgi:hypothetical protein
MKAFLNKIGILMGMVCLSFSIYAQQSLNNKISVNYNQQRLSEILSDLAKKYQLNFSYSNADVPLNKRISVKASSKSLKNVLDQVTQKCSIQWQQVGNQIIIKPVIKTSRQAENISEGAAQLFQTVRGIVIDKENNVPVSGATVSITSVNPVRRIFTDSEGKFRLPGIPVGRHQMEILAEGFQPNTLSQILVSSGKELVLDVEMKELVKALETVVINGNANNQRPLNEMANTSARSFSVEETSRYAASLFDPARMAQSFAGVTAGNDLNNDIVIRGNSSKGLQWRLEGVEIINPNHFGEEGSSAGGVSMISSSMLTSSDFFTGAFPAEYGNALSGVFDLQFRKGNTEKNERAFMIGVLGTEASMEGPFKKGSKSSYLVNYRYSTLGLLDKIGVSPWGNSGTPIYQDIAFNLNFPTTKAGTFSLFGIGGISRQDQRAEKDFTQWDEFYDKFDREFRYSSGSAGLKHLWILNNKVYLKNILSYSVSEIKDNADTLTNTYQSNIFGRDSYGNSSWRYSGMINFKANAKNTLRAGTIISRLNFDLSSLAFKRQLNKLSRILDAAGDAWNNEGYFQWKHQFSDRLSINTGLHASYFNLSDSWSIEPRLGLNWDVKPDQQISFGAGIHNRLEPMAFYYANNELPDGTVVTSNRKLSPTKALHVVGGYEKRFSGKLRLKAEAYYQHLFDVPVNSDPALNFSTLNVSDAYYIYSRNYQLLKNEGTGKNTGLELTLEKSLDRGYYFMITSSLFDSRFKASSGKEFNTNYNSHYVSNIVAGKEWKTRANDKNLFGLNAKLMYTGGRRYSPINLAESLAIDEQVVYEDRVNSLKTSPYFRLDLSMTYRINRPKVSHAFFADVQNVMNRRNELGQFYNSDKNNIETLKLSGLIPSLYYRIEF